MPTTRLTLAAALVSLTALAGAAHAQMMTVSPRGQYGAMITTPGGAQMPAYAVPNGVGGTNYVIPQPYGYGQSAPACPAWRMSYGHCIQ